MWCGNPVLLPFHPERPTSTILPRRPENPAIQHALQHSGMLFLCAASSSVSMLFTLNLCKQKAEYFSNGAKQGTITYPQPVNPTMPVKGVFAMGASSHPAPLSPVSAVCPDPFFGMPVPEVPVHAWRLIRWDTDMPPEDADTQSLSAMLQEVFSTAGVCACTVSPDRDHVLILLAHTAFPAPVHCNLAAWLCAHHLMDQCLTRFGREGSVQVSHAFPDRALWQDQELLPITDWWNLVSPISPSQAHRFRDLLVTQIRRGRAGSLGGCLRRILRNAEDPGSFCAALVPVAAEAVWNQVPDFSLQLTDGLSLPLLARRPEEALYEWTASLTSLLMVSQASVSGPDIRRVQELILQNPSLPYTQERLAHSLGLSPVYFCRLFHAQTGQTFSDFLASARIRMAQTLLRDGSRSLQEVAELCGYPNKSYFCKVFRKYTHVSPGAYAAGHAADDSSLS